MSERNDWTYDKFVVEHYQDNPRLILIRGQHNSGKTELAKYFCKVALGSMFHLETDMYLTDVNGVRVFDKEKIPAAHSWCRKNIGILLNSGYSVVVANNFTRNWEVQQYVDLAVARNLPYAVLKTTATYPNVKKHPTTLLKTQAEKYEPYEKATRY